MNKIFILCRKELLIFSRDRRTLLVLILVPLLSIPVMVYMFSLATRNPKLGSMVVSGLFQAFPLFLLSLIGQIGLDITAGEKERGTMETTLTLFATRKELVYGKFYAVVIVSLLTTATLLLFTEISYFSTTLMSSNATELSFSSFSGKILFGFLTVALYFSFVYPAFLVLIGLYARSIKEALSYIAPLFLLAVVPVLATSHGVRLTLTTALIPGLNCFLIVRQYLDSSLDWIYWVILPGTAMAYSYICLRGAIFLMRRDAVLNRI